MQEVINWELLKFKYEILGISLSELAVSHKVSEPVLSYNAKEWKKIPLEFAESLDLSEITSLEDILKKLGNQTATQTKAFAVLKQKFLGPKYVELETVLLHKAIEMAAAINGSDPFGVKVLKTLSEVLNSLLERNPLLSTENETAINDSSRKWEVIIVDANKEEI